MSFSFPICSKIDILKSNITRKDNFKKRSEGKSQSCSILYHVRFELRPLPKRIQSQDLSSFAEMNIFVNLLVRGSCKVEYSYLYPVAKVRDNDEQIEFQSLAL